MHFRQESRSRGVDSVGPLNGTVSLSLPRKKPRQSSLCRTLSSKWMMLWESDKKIEELGLNLENTIIVFTSDNGGVVLWR